MNQKSLDSQKPRSTHQTFAWSLKSILLSFTKSKDFGDSLGESSSSSPPSCIPTDLLQYSGQPKINVGSLNTSTGKINWGAAHDLGPGLKKWFPVLVQSVEGKKKDTIGGAATMGGIFCILLFYVFLL